MIDGKKIIAFTPCGRKRYMDLLTAHVAREHERGHIDQWVLFQNAFTQADAANAAQLAERYPWCVALQPRDGRRGLATPFTAHLSDFYKWMTQEKDAIYVRLDDDIIYIDENAIPRLVKYRLANPKPYAIFPVIINNVRTSYQMQQVGVVPKEWGTIKNEMCNVLAWKDSRYVYNLHRKALDSLSRGTLVKDFTMPTGSFEDITYGDKWAAGNISINCFAAFGSDLFGAPVPWDEEGHFSLFQPKALNRPNARVGDAMVIHFAYHTQTRFMDSTGILAEYAKLDPTSIVVPPSSYPVPAPQRQVVRQAIRRFPHNVRA